MWAVIFTDRKRVFKLNRSTEISHSSLTSALTLLSSAVTVIEGGKTVHFYYFGKY